MIGAPTITATTTFAAKSAKTSPMSNTATPSMAENTANRMTVAATAAAPIPAMYATGAFMRPDG